MKNTSWLSNSGLGLALGLGMFAYSAAAQSFEAVKITLPNPVTVGTTTLAPGEYLFSDVRDDGSASVVMIVSTAGGPGVVALVTRISMPGSIPAEHTRVTLRHTDDKYQLTQIWMAGHNYGYELLSGAHHQ